MKRKRQTVKFRFKEGLRGEEQRRKGSQNCPKGSEARLLSFLRPKCSERHRWRLWVEKNAAQKREVSLVSLYSLYSFFCYDIFEFFSSCDDFILQWGHSEWKWRMKVKRMKAEINPFSWLFWITFVARNGQEILWTAVITFHLRPSLKLEIPIARFWFNKPFCKLPSRKCPQLFQLQSKSFTFLIEISMTFFSRNLKEWWKVDLFITTLKIY